MCHIILPKNKRIMDTMEKKISRDDKIFATLTHNGTDIADISGNNFSCMADIIKNIFSKSGKWFGIAMLSIRNYSQGWRVSFPVSFRLQPRKEPKLDGRLYVLPFA